MADWPAPVDLMTRNFALLLTSPTIAVTVNSPTEGGTVTSSEVAVSYSFTGTQANRRVRVWSDAGQTALVYDSGVVVSALKSHTIPGGNLDNLTTYYLQVDITTDGGQPGQSDLVSFDTSFAPSANVANVTVTAVPAGEPPNNLVGWDQIVPQGAEVFSRYSVDRRPAGEASWTRIATVDAIDTLAYRDYRASPGVELEYAVRWTAIDGENVLESARQDPAPSATLTFPGAWVHDTGDEEHHAQLFARDVQVASEQGRVYRRARGRRKSTPFVDALHERELDLALIPELITDPALWEALEDLEDRQYTEAATLCLRLGFRPGAKYFVVIDDLRGQMATALERASLRFREVHFEEAV